MKYIEKLKDPRWQKKRLEILQRDGFTCRSCKCDFETLAVHHIKYIPSTEPWDYPDDLLVTLCEFCHENERDERPEMEQALLKALKDKGFLYRDIETLVGKIMDGEILPSIHINGPQNEKIKRNIAQALRDYVFSTKDSFTLRQCYSDLNIVTDKDKGAIRKSLNRLLKDNEIKKVAGLIGGYRVTKSNRSNSR